MKSYDKALTPALYPASAGWLGLRVRDDSNNDSTNRNRPLTRLKDFEDFKGFEAKVETTVPIEGQKRFRGRVIGTEGDRVKLKADTGDMEFLFEDIEKAKLILTDELVAALLKSR